MTEDSKNDELCKCIRCKWRRDVMNRQPPMNREGYLARAKFLEKCRAEGDRMGIRASWYSDEAIAEAYQLAEKAEKAESGTNPQPKI